MIRYLFCFGSLASKIVAAAFMFLVLGTILIVPLACSGDKHEAVDDSNSVDAQAIDDASVRADENENSIPDGRSQNKETYRDEVSRLGKKMGWDAEKCDGTIRLMSIMNRDQREAYLNNLKRAVGEVEVFPDDNSKAENEVVENGGGPAPLPSSGMTTTTLNGGQRAGSSRATAAVANPGREREASGAAGIEEKIVAKKKEIRDIRAVLGPLQDELRTLEYPVFKVRGEMREVNPKEDWITIFGVAIPSDGDESHPGKVLPPGGYLKVTNAEKIDGMEFSHDRLYFIKKEPWKNNFGKVVPLRFFSTRPLLTKGEAEQERNKHKIQMDPLYAEIGALEVEIEALAEERKLASPSAASIEEIAVTLPGDVPMSLVYIPEGTFEMGSRSNEPGRNSGEPRHEVTLTQGYYLGKFEVTQAQWAAVMGTNPAQDYGVGDNYPVYFVSWDDVCGGSAGSDCAANSFIGRLNAHLGTDAFRLPTSAEWERAARAGTQSAFSFDLGNNQNWIKNPHYSKNDCDPLPEAESFMVWRSNSNSHSEEVGDKRPNPFGLYNMHGNLMEWVADEAGSYPLGFQQTDPIGSKHWHRVIRGGYWYSCAERCRSASKVSFEPQKRDYVVGFRVAKSK